MGMGKQACSNASLRVGWEGDEEVEGPILCLIEKDLKREGRDYTGLPVRELL